MLGILRGRDRLRNSHPMRERPTRTSAGLPSRLSIRIIPCSHLTAPNLRLPTLNKQLPGIGVGNRRPAKIIF
jgi:hypothetical protein